MSKNCSDFGECNEWYNVIHLNVLVVQQFVSVSVLVLKFQGQNLLV